MRAINVTRKMRPLPGAKLCIDVFTFLGNHFFEPFDPCTDLRVIAGGESLQLFVFPLQHHQRFLKIKIVFHHVPSLLISSPLPIFTRPTANFSHSISTAFSPKSPSTDLRICSEGSTVNAEETAIITSELWGTIKWRTPSHFPLFSSKISLSRT